MPPRATAGKNRAFAVDLIDGAIGLPWRDLKGYPVGPIDVKAAAEAVHDDF